MAYVIKPGTVTSEDIYNSYNPNYVYSTNNAKNFTGTVNITALSKEHQEYFLKSPGLVFSGITKLILPIEEAKIDTTRFPNLREAKLLYKPDNPKYSKGYVPCFSKGSIQVTITCSC